MLSGRVWVWRPSIRREVVALPAEAARRALQVRRHRAVLKLAPPCVLTQAHSRRERPAERPVVLLAIAMPDLGWQKQAHRKTKQIGGRDTLFPTDLDNMVYFSLRPPRAATRPPKITLKIRPQTKSPRTSGKRSQAGADRTPVSDPNNVYELCFFELNPV